MLDEIKKYAIKNNVPIIEDQGKDFLIKIIKENNYHNILEIGSAIGYSAIIMAKISEKNKVVTIERDSIRYNLAKKNINEMGLEKQIIIYHDDALLFDESKLENKFDLIFIDAAKAQYQKFFEKYEKHLNDNGCIIVDNINFHGFVEGKRKTTNRNTKQLVGKIRRFNEWITTNDNYEVDYYDVGDGIFVIKRKM
ncbi:putative O-methyltransferase YrrM [Bacilli bacterium PM5-3]|nr:putative O-methyltransferase YrrM [Bacilli bacterium PM5-3]